MNRFRVFPIVLCLTLVHPTFAQTPSKSSTPNSAQKDSAPPPATVTGSGTANYVPLWTGSSTLGNARIYQNGSGSIGVGTTTPQVALDVVGRVNVSKSYRILDNDVLAIPTGVSSGNLAVGIQALPSITTGTDNTATGSYGLQFNTTGVNNTADGAFALTFNTSGGFNTAAGVNALDSNSEGNYNTAVGEDALFNNFNSSDNTAIGYSALYANISGASNTALGQNALAANQTGNFNIAVGATAAANVQGSYNIDIGSTGSTGDNNTIRIGTIGNQTTFFAAGIYGVSGGNNEAIPVLVDSSGQLVTASSSRRFKEDIQDMGDASRGLMQLRPVTFRYKKPLADGSQPIQYGLIAEEVAEIYPDLVAYSADGQIETVKYQLLDPMLLNEVQRQQAEIRALQERLDRMDATLASMPRTKEAR
ncbi:MAG: tail fiber domain-containing protein [Candidatus Sulfotelmatobacter sp.]|jgi:trimeric autotransporter adhesin